MKFAFCLYEYFPFGGQQRNFMQIIQTCRAREHQVDVYTTSWQGEIPTELTVSVLPVRGFTNHRRRESLSAQFSQRIAAASYDAVVGSVKMPGLDVYYAADNCYAAKASEKSVWYRMTPRCRSYLNMEKVVFDQTSKTEILLLTEKEKPAFMHYYGTSEDRFHLLPPGISKGFLAHPNNDEIREKLRGELNIESETTLVLLVGSGFKRKGVDRALHAVSALPARMRENTLLLVVGQDNPHPFRWLAWRLGILNHVRFLQGRKDIIRFFLTADLLLHPAYRENTGTVLIEAMAAGLPVLATEVCGFSNHIEHAGAGEILPSPFEQEALNRRLHYMLTSDKKDKWQQNGKTYVAKTDVFSRAEKAADIIERVAVKSY